MYKILLFSTFIFSATLSFGQSNQTEISDLAKRYSDALCTCPVQDFMQTVALDFKEKKISQEEFNQGIKMVGVEMIQCTRHILKEVKTFSTDEVDFFKSETTKYNSEFFKAQKEAAKKQP